MFERSKSLDSCAFRSKGAPESRFGSAWHLELLPCLIILIIRSQVSTPFTRKWSKTSNQQERVVKACPRHTQLLFCPSALPPTRSALNYSLFSIHLLHSSLTSDSFKRSGDIEYWDVESIRSLCIVLRPSPLKWLRSKVQVGSAKSSKPPSVTSWSQICEIDAVRKIIQDIEKHRISK